MADQWSSTADHAPEANPGGWSSTTDHAPDAALKLQPGASDEDIIKHYGYDPAVIKKAHLYSQGTLKSLMDHPVEMDMTPMDSPGVLSDAAHGFASTLLGINQLASHGVSKLTGNPADAQFSDLLTKVSRDAYGRIRSDPSKLAEAGGQMLIPIPGGPAETVLGAVAKGALTGTAASATQPVDVEGPKGDYLVPKLEQVGTGAALGGAVGGLLSGAGAGIDKLVAKGVNAKTTKLPEEIAADLQAKADASAADAKQIADESAGRILQEKDLTKQAADEAQGRVTQAQAAADAAKRATRSTVDNATVDAQKTAADLAARKAELAARVTAAQTAADNAAQTQATGVGTSASLASSRLRNAMGDTPFHGTDELTAAASAGDGRAAAVLRQLNEAGDNPDDIQQASIQLQNWMTRQKATQLYDRVGELASEHASGDVPLNQTESVLGAALSQAEEAKIPDKSLISTLRTIQDNIGAGKKDSIVDNSYEAIRRFDDDLGTLIRSGSKGTNALVSDTSVPALNAIRGAVRADLDRFTASVPQLRDAAKEADQYYRTVRVPFKQADIAGAGTTPDADRIYDGFIKSGSGDKAQRYYDALDPKGRAAVRYQMATDASNAATDPVRGTFDPQKFYHALNDLADAHGVFFKGADKVEMDGLKKFAQQTALMQDAAKEAGAATQAAGTPVVTAARQAAINARTNAQRATRTAAAQGTAIDQGLALDTARANAAAEDVARGSAGRQLQYQATAENAARDAAPDQAAADAAKQAADADVRRFSKWPIGQGAGLGMLAAEGLAHINMPGASLAVGGLSAAAWTVKFLTQTQIGRRYLKASAFLKPGTPAMQGWLNTVMKLASATAARAATLPQSPPQDTTPPSAVPTAAIQRPAAAPLAQTTQTPPPPAISAQGAANSLHTAKLEREANAIAV
jgi:hypothetical protein